MSVATSIVSWLNAMPELADCQAHTLIPENASASNPYPFITVQRTGGNGNGFFDTALVTVDVWAPTMISAEQWASIVRKRLLECDRLPALYNPSIIGESENPYVDGYPRYEINMQINCTITDL